MKKTIWMCGISLLFLGLNAKAQELFNYTEPASNMPANSVGIRLANNLLDEAHLGQKTYQFLPEIMLGINNKLMLHADAVMSNSAKPFRAIGAGLYAKYRFYSNDVVHRHFRMAAFARLGWNRGHLHYQEIETNGMNTGAELGLIATQLLHKQAISATLSYEQITDNGVNTIHIGNAHSAYNLALSTGRLISPKNYVSYKQTNFNLMCELLMQYQPTLGLYYCDIAPSIQFIVNSQTRIDIGYRKQMTGTIDRMATDALMIRIEHLMFNVLKRSR
jgi:hypothetical protein